jgi:ATP phosphoribosyltransferase
MLREALRLLSGAGLPVSPSDAETTGLVLDRPGWRFLLARPRDVGLYVEHGIAHLGIAGKDTLLEHPRQVVEALDLGIGPCRLVMAVPRSETPPPSAAAGSIDLRSLRRVATKYPRLTEAYLRQSGSPAQIVELHGSVEMAAALGLADAVVDLTQTGRTLAENGLVEVATIVQSSARLIINPVAYRMRPAGLSGLLDRLRCLVSGEIA